MSGNRGQSNVVSAVLLLGITITAITLTVGLGAEALSNAKQSAELERSGQAMTQFDAKASLVAHGEQGSHRVSVGRSGSNSELYIDEDAGWMNVTIFNATSGAVKTVVMNQTLGAFVSEEGESVVAYQGGGVWRKGSKNGSMMVSPPEFHYRARADGRPTLTLPLIVLQGNDQQVNGNIRIQANETRGKYPVVGNANRTNPLEDGEITIQIHSEYYRAWGSFFEDRTDGSAKFDHANDTATIELVIPSDERTLSEAVSGVAPGEDIKLQGSGNFPAFVDAYNSSNGDYDTTKQNNGTLTAAGDLDITGNANVTGTVSSGGSVSIGGNAEIGGDVEYSTTNSISGGADIEGTVRSIEGVDVDDSIDSTVTDKVDSLATDNDNGGGPITGDTVDFTSNTATLDDGEYYLDNINMNGENLTLDTTSGDIVIGVENSITIDNGAVISVQGDNQVRFYVKDDITVHSGTEFDIPDEVANRLWIYGTGDMTFDMTANQGNPTSFDGIVYAPDQSSDFDIGHAELFGAVVAGDIDINTGGSVHFDESLLGTNPLQTVNSPPTLTYLHVSVSSLLVSDGTRSSGATSTVTVTTTATPTSTATPTATTTATPTPTATSTATSTPSDAAPSASIDSVTDSSQSGGQGGNKAEFTVGWSASDDSEISDVTIELIDSNDNVVDSVTPSASGTSASGTETLSDNGGYNGEYTIKVIVTDSASQTNTTEKTDTADGTDP